MDGQIDNDNGIYVIIYIISALVLLIRYLSLVWADISE